jgi:hypothetical protein
VRRKCALTRDDLNCYFSIFSCMLPRPARSSFLNWTGTLLLVLLTGTPADKSLAQAQPTASQSKTSSSQSTAAQLKRVLPLNRFPYSRTAGSDAHGFYFMPTAIGDDYFDGTDPPERVERHLRIAKAAGVKYLRCAFSWNGIEPERGVYRWQFWDDLVARAERHGIGVIPYVAYTPEWAARSKQDFWRQPPSDPQLYAEFMERIAARYRGRIQSWELWNEPDLQEYWTSSAEEFGSLVKLAAVAVCKGDPAAVIVLGGVSLGPTEFFRTLFRDKVDQYVDVIAMHAYPESWHEQRLEEIFNDWVPKMNELIQQGGSGADFWLNEAGYPDYRYSPAFATQNHTHAYYQYEHTRDYQATFLFKLFTLASASGKISLTGWYRIDDFSRAEKRLPNDRVHFHLGVLDARHQPKPDFAALRFFDLLFAQPVRRLQVMVKSNRPNSQAVVQEFENKEHQVIVTGWLRSSEYNEVRDHTGTLKDNRRESVSIPVPCRNASGVQFYSPTGKARRERARLFRGRLQGIELQGERVFIARFRCER